MSLRLRLLIPGPPLYRPRSPGRGVTCPDPVGRLLTCFRSASETATERRVDVLVASDAGVDAGFEVAARLVGGHGEEVVRDVWIGEAVSVLRVHE